MKKKKSRIIHIAIVSFMLTAGGSSLLHATTEAKVAERRMELLMPNALATMEYKQRLTPVPPVTTYSHTTKQHKPLGEAGGSTIIQSPQDLTNLDRKGTNVILKDTHYQSPAQRVIYKPLFATKPKN